MNKCLFKLITLLCSFLSFNSIAQESNYTPEFKHQIGFGGMYGGPNIYILSVSYIKNLKRKNELTFPLYYYHGERSKAISGSVAYYWATNKKSKFTIYLCPEFNVYFLWTPKFKSDLYINRYGYFAILGLSPSYKISARFKIALDLKIGHGYLWSKNNSFSHNDVLYTNYSVIGWVYTGFAILRVNYNF